MKPCRICGEEKTKKDFFCIYGFSQYKKKRWCRECQRLFLDMKKEQEKQEKEIEKQKKWELPANFTVSFL